MRRLFCSLALIAPLSAQYSQAPANPVPAVAIISSVINGEAGNLKDLLAHGGSANAMDAQGRSALFNAVLLKQVQAAGLLLDAGATGLNELPVFPLPGGSRLNLLSIAAWNGQPEMVRLLLAHGANPKALDGDGRDALAGAIAVGNGEILQMLLDAGVDPNRRWKVGYASCLLAATYGRVEILQTLVDHQGKVDARDDFGLTPLMLAVQMGREDAVRWLLEHGAPVYPRNAWQQSALGQAKQLKNPELGKRMADLLHKAGADEADAIRPMDADFLKAAAEGNLAKVKGLLAQGADVNARGTFIGASHPLPFPSGPGHQSFHA